MRQRILGRCGLQSSSLSTMSQRDLLWFLAGASMAALIGAAWLLVALSKSGPGTQRTQASLPSWHPPTQASPMAQGADLRTVAREMRRQRNHQAAREAYAALERQGALTADEWADYADVVASAQNGDFAGEPTRLIGEALKADPAHPKALWLRASLAHQQADYKGALGWWRRLQEQIPRDSPDQRIISANIEEATRLMAGPTRPALRAGALRAPELDLRLGTTIP
jgi:hypothetical protein